MDMKDAVLEFLKMKKSIVFYIENWPKASPPTRYAQMKIDELEKAYIELTGETIEYNTTGKDHIIQEAITKRP